MTYNIINFIKELSALENSIKYYELDVVIKPFFNEDKRKKAKFVLTVKNVCISPKLNYNDMNHFIFGMGVQKTL